jgi:hypothetical protein
MGDEVNELIGKADLWWLCNLGIVATFGHNVQKLVAFVLTENEKLLENGILLETNLIKEYNYNINAFIFIL